MPKLRVGVLMGGRSMEREISFNSGRTICDHLDTTRYAIVPIYQTFDGQLYLLPWHFLHRGKTSDFEHRLAREASAVSWEDLPELIDFAYIAQHGRYGEDGILQGCLELLGIPYLGSSIYASALCMDKEKTNIVLNAQGIAVPKGIAVDADMAIDAVIATLATKNIPAPWLIKPHNEGSSLGISVARTKNELAAAIYTAAYVHPDRAQRVLVEEYITGMEFSCIVLEDYKNKQFIPLPPTEVVPEAGSTIFDYEQKYMPGRAMKYTPARCSQETISAIQATCARIMAICELETIGRIDGFVTADGRVVIVDPNSLSGMAPSSFLFREAAEIGMSHSHLINHLIETDLARYGMLEDIEQHEEQERSMTQQPSQKIRVGVLMGGATHEREISLESGRNVTYKLSPQKYAATPIFVDQFLHLYPITQKQLVKNSTKEITDSLERTQRISWQSLKSSYDFIFIALHGGAGENGSVQGMLEMIDMPYNGSSVFASSLCMDKYKTAAYLKAAGFATPEHILVTKKEWLSDREEIIARITQELSLPLIVKPHDDGCSVMVCKTKTIEETIAAIEAVIEKHPCGVLVEQFIRGMELTVGVMGNQKPQALIPSQAIATGDILSIEEKFLPGAGENQTPAPLPADVLEEIQKTIEAVYKAAGCRGYARIDCFYQAAHESATGAARTVILEINSLPGLTPATCIFHQAAEAGMRPMEFLDRIIELGFEAHRPATVTTTIPAKKEMVA